jgi:hypothetical protein
MQQGGPQPGSQAQMLDKPVTIRDTYKGAGKLQDKVALITGGDSGIGRAVAVHFAREGAHVAILYLNEHEARALLALALALGGGGKVGGGCCLLLVLNPTHHYAKHQPQPQPKTTNHNQ